MNVIGSIWGFIVAVLNYLLQFLYNLVGNYGVAIILLTILVKLALLPLTIKQTRSMLAMQRIQPEIKKLQEKYKGDKEKLSQEMMKFYKENKVNPLSGCLPLIMQMPIFIALYTVLRKYLMTPPTMLLGSVVQNNIPEFNSGLIIVKGSLIRDTSFLWIENLSDSVRVAGIFGYFLIILLMASTWYSQKQVMTDPRQKGMMYAMPLIMGFIGLSLPAGVILYWVTTNILQIIQQYGIQWWEKKEEAKAGEETARLKAEAKKSGKQPAKEEKPAEKVGKQEAPRPLPSKQKKPQGAGADKARKSEQPSPERGKGGKQPAAGAKPQGGKPLPKQPPGGRRKPPPRKK